MLRSIPSTPLVCLVIFLSTIFLNASWAAAPDESLDILLKPNQGVSAPGPTVHKAKSRARYGFQGAAPAVVMYPPPPMGITKVKPRAVCGPVASPFQGCILPKPRPGQWEMGIAAIFARTRGIVAWPRYTPFIGWGANNEIDLNALGLPAHWTVPEFTARYQFRANWAIRYSVLGWDLSGGTDSFQGGNNNGFGITYFGNIPLTWGQQFQSKWQHSYQTLSLVYDAVRTCNAALSVYAGWVHAEDKISVNCTFCGWYTGIFSKGGDSVLVGLQLQQCLRTAPNGGTFSCDNRAAVIFGDDVQGWDISLGGRYSIPLNCGRSGYMKGGYRFVDYKKTQQDFILTNAIEGGFVEFGFIF